MNDHTKTFDAVARELCRRVGAEYPPPDGKPIKPTDYEWTEEEEADFKQWLIGYLKTVPLYKRAGVRYIKKEADWFMFQYGWKTKAEAQNEDD